MNCLVSLRTRFIVETACSVASISAIKKVSCLNSNILVFAQIFIVLPVQYLIIHSVDSTLMIGLSCSPPTCVNKYLLAMIIQIGQIEGKELEWSLHFYIFDLLFFLGGGGIKKNVMAPNTIYFFFIVNPSSRVT